MHSILTPVVVQLVHPVDPCLRVSVQTWQVVPTNTAEDEQVVHALDVQASQLEVQAVHATPFNLYPAEQAEHVDASVHVEHPVEQA